MRRLKPNRLTYLFRWWARDTRLVVKKASCATRPRPRDVNPHKIRLRTKWVFCNDIKIRNSQFFNMTFNETQQLHSSAPSALLIFKATVIGVIIVFNIFANSLTLVILSKVREMNPVTKVFMTSMTLSDLGWAFIFMTILTSTAVDRWPFGAALCSFVGFLTVLFPIATTLSLFSVTCERFLAVTQPFKYNTLMTVPRALVISLGVWLIGITAAVLNGFMPGRAIYFSQIWHVCTPGTEDPSDVDILSTVSVLLFGTVPGGLILAMFTKLFLVAKYHNAKIAAQERVVGQVGRKSDRKALTTFFIMTIWLTTWGFPLNIVFVYDYITKKEVSPWLASLVQLAGFSNTFINVVIYYLRNTVFRQTAETLISRIPCLKMTIETPVISLDTVTWLKKYFDSMCSWQSLYTRAL